ncbi:MAG: hypothetical protein V5A88_03680 [Candidatus Thermoplasmatota archaeon]
MKSIYQYQPRERKLFYLEDWHGKCGIESCEWDGSVNGNRV